MVFCFVDRKMKLGLRSERLHQQLRDTIQYFCPNIKTLKMNEPNKLNVIITGATGMIGEGVLIECLKHPDVEKILVINRKPCGYTNPKLKEIIHQDFYDLTPIQNQLAGYDACFFCLGVSVIGLKEEEYFKITHTLTLHTAQTLAKQNTTMVFEYISGSGTDNTEKGRTMWARIKGKTENDLMKLPFKKAYAVRPAFLKATEGMKNTLPYYKYFGWMYPLLKLVFPKYVSTLKELGLAMIQLANQGYDKQVIDVKDILRLAKMK